MIYIYSLGLALFYCEWYLPREWSKKLERGWDYLVLSITMEILAMIYSASLFDAI